MTVNFVSQRVPLIDPKTLTMTTPWYYLMQRLFNVTGGGVDNDQIDLIAPGGGADSVASALASLESDLGLGPTVTVIPIAPPDDVTPPQQIIYVALDDVLPALGSLRDEVAMLRSQIDDLLKGPTL